MPEIDLVAEVINGRDFIVYNDENKEEIYERGNSEGEKYPKLFGRVDLSGRSRLEIGRTIGRGGKHTNEIAAETGAFLIYKYPNKLNSDDPITEDFLIWAYDEASAKRAEFELKKNLDYFKKKIEKEEARAKEEKEEEEKVDETVQI
jgi:hypothetical protein